MNLHTLKKFVKDNSVIVKQIRCKGVYSSIYYNVSNKTTFDKITLVKNNNVISKTEKGFMIQNNFGAWVIETI